MTQQVVNSAPIAAAVIVKDGQVLMVRRRVKEGQLSWQFPAGAVEPGETGEEAAVRETREEVGLTVAAIKPSVSAYIRPLAERWYTWRAGS